MEHLEHTVDFQLRCFAPAHGNNITVRNNSSSSVIADFVRGTGPSGSATRILLLWVLAPESLRLYNKYVIKHIYIKIDLII